MKTNRLRLALAALGLVLSLAFGMAGGAGAQTLSVSPAVIPAGHSGNITLTLTLTPGGGDTTLVGSTLSVTNNSSFPNSTSVTKVSQSITDATHATLTVTTGSGGGAATVSDGTASATLTQKIPLIRTSPTYAPASAATAVTVYGLGTLWLTDAPAFSVSGVAGASVSAATFTDNQTATLTVTTGSGTGNLTLTDPSTGASTRIYVGTPVLRTYVPLFTSLPAGSTGLSVASNSGLVATTNGTSGAATYNLNTYADWNQFLRMSVLVEYNGDTTNGLSFHTNTTSPNSVYGFFGGNLNATGGVMYASGNIQAAQWLPLISGQRYWISVSLGASGITEEVLPAFGAGLAPGATGSATSPQADCYNVFPYTQSAQSANYETDDAWNINSVTLTNSSSTTRILGMLIQQGSLAGGTDPQCQPPALVAVAVNGDTTARLRVCPQYDGSTTTPLVIVSHPNNSDESSGLRSIDPDSGAALALLSRGGYNEAWMRATTNYGGTTYSAPPASGWGSDAQEVYWKALADFCKTNLVTSKVYWYGQSMGGVTGLRFHMKYPGYLSGLYGVSPVTNLSHAYSVDGFSSIIDSAYGTSGNFITGGSAATYDPNLNPSAFTSLPIRLWYGTADTLIPPAIHELLFAANVNAAGGKVTTVAVPGGGHLDKAALWDGVDMLKFFSALNNPASTSVLPIF